MKHSHQQPTRRAPQRQPVPAIPVDNLQYPVVNLVVRDGLQPRATSSADESGGCAPDDNSPRCEKPVSSSTMTLPIILGTAIPVVAALIILFVLHRRNARKLKAEDRMDKTKSMDFGLEYPVTGKKGKGGGPAGNSSGRHKNQLSLDMDVAAPYLLPPELNGSRESLHSMSRVYIADDDKYRPSNSVHRMPYGNGSAAPSINSQNNMPGSRFNRDSSVYTASIRQHEDSTESLTADLLGHSGKMASTTPVRGASLPSNRNVIPELQVPEPALDVSRNTKNGNQPAPGPGLHAAQQDGRDSYIDGDSGDLRRSHLHLVPHIGFENASELDASKPNKSTPAGSVELSAQIETAPSEKESSRDQAPPKPAPHKPPMLKLNEESSFEGLNFGTSVAEANSNKPSQVNNDDASLPQLVEPQAQAQATPAQPQNRASTMGGLEVNYGDRLEPRRLSYGFRPLPPAAEPGEDAEERAMRIRSFYKEYFDDASQGAFDYYTQTAEPSGHDDHRGGPANGNQGYYEQDHSQGYNQEYGDYYQDNVDPVYDQYYDDMYAEQPRPFAEPPTRRAMTPPPRAPPRFHNNNLPRPGSGGSSRGPPPPRSYSSQSNRYNGPPPRGTRAPSSLRKNAVPEEPLLILPTPHLLKEDAFASPIGFAPAPRSRDFRAGTESEVGSVRGGMRPYSPTVRAHTPLASAFDELSSLPNPHQLRKSSTFTGLDFAPPRKFKNETDNMSDAGSIRSNKTGLSAAYNIRSGAYRVSRLPQEVVPTTDNMTANLKPTWNMHNN
ncbi:hypothetical protein Dda_0457 [Drechslerella dactyloides]|uniref:Uncharacterized protein n=1 Tax=Drechslerella dactyloides TaxID=74499 RepID=A0AAD6J7V3_DREDA|nr:hypothetical protein Dda_0457 [Drechslerella dactyloides]